MGFELWTFKKITDYWDNTKENSIYHFSQIIGNYSEQQKEATYREISQLLRDYTKLIDDFQLARLAFYILDEIYISVNHMPEYNEKVVEYLQKTAGTIFEQMEERNVAVHYLCNNKFHSYHLPMFVFKHCFMPARVRYICAHEVAKTLMRKDGLQNHEMEAHLEEYLPKARPLVEEMIEICHNENVSYVYLEIGGVEQDFMRSMSFVHAPGTMTVVRSLAPEVGSKCQLWWAPMEAEANK